MSSKSYNLLLQATVTDGSAQDLAEALDLGDFIELEILVRVLSAGDGEAPLLQIQHAPVNEDDAFIDFPEAISVDLSVEGTTWVHVPHFTRWVRWRTAGTLTSSAMVTVHVVAKS